MKTFALFQLVNGQWKQIDDCKAKGRREAIRRFFPENEIKPGFKVRLAE